MSFIDLMFQGEELALTDVHISWEDTVDPAACNTDATVYEETSRDPVRTPFPWDSTAQAGFSTNASTWLPLATDYLTVNVMAQKTAAFSHLKLFEQLTQIRKTPTFQTGTFTSYAIGTNVLAYSRALTGSDTYIVLLNFGATNQVLNLVTTFPTLASQRLEVIATSLQSLYVAG